MISGVSIHFLITDSQGILPSAGKLEPAANIGIVTAGGIYRSAAAKSRSGAVVEAVVTVPHTLPASTSIFSRTLKVTTPTGGSATAAAIGFPQGVTDINIPLNLTR